MKYLHFIGFMFLLFVVGACNKDKEFVKQDLYANFAVQYPLDTTFRIPQYDTLRITPTIGGMDEGKQYTYEWKLYVKEGKTQIISTKRNLAQEISLPEGNYSLQFSVVEKASGVTALSNIMRLNVTGIYYEGWLVTNNVDNQGKMSFLRTDGEIISDPLQDANDKMFPGKAIGSIAVIADGFFNTAVNQIMYFTDRGLTMFDPASLLQITETNQNLFAPISFNSRPAFVLNTFNTDQYFIGNGGLHAAYIPFGGSDDSKLETFSSRFSGDYDLYPFIFPDAGGNIFVYDNKGKRFFIGEYYGRELYSDKAVGKTMLGADKTINSQYLTLLKDGNNYTIATCRLSSTSSTGSQINEVPFSPIGIDVAPVFAASTEFAIGYFSAGNKIYSVNGVNGNLTLIYTFPAGSIIGDIQMMKEGTDVNRKLIVGVNNGKSGEVYYLYLGTQGNLNNTRPPEVFKGFGNIVHLNYRTSS